MIEKIILAAGCFWSVQYKLSQLNGVVNTLAVYAGGETANPTYEQVCSDETGHAEAVLVEYNTDILSTGELLRYFFQIHDASQKDRQGPDIGTQYRSAIFYFTDEQKREAELIINEMKNDKYYKGLTIQTLILEATTFYKAEEYHQNYYIKKGY
jgi:peptide methionine sulfoxide reductase msrA/msrB